MSGILPLPFQFSKALLSKPFEVFWGINMDVPNASKVTSPAFCIDGSGLEFSSLGACSASITGTHSSSRPGLPMPENRLQRDLQGLGV